MSETVREYCERVGTDPAAVEAHLQARRLLVDGERITDADVPRAPGSVVNIGLDLADR